MKADFEMFPGKSLSALFEDIYKNQSSKKKYISDLIHEFRKQIKSSGDIAMIGPLIKDLIRISVENDDLLLKMATIGQRILLAQNKNSDSDGILTEEERQQLLKELDDVQSELERINDIEDELSEVREKIESSKEQ